jgi:hypothetical protein
MDDVRILVTHKVLANIRTVSGDGKVSDRRRALVCHPGIKRRFERPGDLLQ